jgi:hypothetical protein
VSDGRPNGDFAEGQPNRPSLRTHNLPPRVIQPRFDTVRQAFSTISAIIDGTDTRFIARVAEMAAADER